MSDKQEFKKLFFNILLIVIGMVLGAIYMSNYVTDKCNDFIINNFYEDMLAEYDFLVNNATSYPEIFGRDLSNFSIFGVDD